jgi:hypothetical protein
VEEGSKDGGRCQEGSAEEDWEDLAKTVGVACFGFLRPFLRHLDAHVDVRLVRTVANLVPVLIKRRHRGEALLLSQMGDDLERVGHGPAGTKRIDHVIKSPNWQAAEVGDFLTERAGEVVRREAARVPEKRALLIVDGSVAEKPESAQQGGLAPVLSTKARRLRRPRRAMGKGYYPGPPGKPTVVPGWTFLSAVVTGWAERTCKRPVALAGWLWYRKVAQTDPLHDALDQPIPTADEATAVRHLVAPLLDRLGALTLLLVADRQFGNQPWISQFVTWAVPFVVRFKKGNHLRAEDAPSVGDPRASAHQRQTEGVPAWKLTQTLLFRQKRTIANPRNPSQPIPIRFGARPVRLVGLDTPLWLVAVSVGRGGRRRRAGEPWRLLTNLPLETYEDVWRVVEADAARWQIEQTIRFNKSVLGVESVRVRDWEPRQKLLGLVALAYAFLLFLLGDGSSALVQRLLRVLHRRGRQARDAWRPLYRLQQALASLWKRHTPSFQGVP